MCMACSVSACMDGSDWERGTALATERDGEILEGETESKKGTYGIDRGSYCTAPCKIYNVQYRLQLSDSKPPGVSLFWDGMFRTT